MAPAKKVAVKKAAAKVATKKAAAAAGKKATAKRAATAKKAPAKRAATAKKAPAKRAATAKKATAKKSPAKKATAKRAVTAKKAPATRTAKRPATTKAAARSAGANGGGKAPKSTAPKSTAPRKAPFDAKFLDAQRELLLQERATYLHQAETLQAEADSLAELREPGDVQFDEESGEGDTLQVERERDLALSARARQEIEEIDRALHKLELGTYGICEVSGEPIPRVRLQAIPQVRERVEYKVGGFSRR